MKHKLISVSVIVATPSGGEYTKIGSFPRDVADYLIHYLVWVEKEIVSYGVQLPS